MLRKFVETVEPSLPDTERKCEDAECVLMEIKCAGDGAA